MSTPAERIHEMRLRANLTMEDVASYLGVQRQAVFKYEKGIVTNIPIDNFKRMAELFGTTPEYLSCWSDDPGSGVVLNPQFLIPRVKKDPYTSAVLEMMHGMSKKQKQQVVDIVRILSGSKG